MPGYLAILLIALHGLAAAVWVGGMFMAYVAVRPAAARVLAVPERTTLWQESFAGFFPWVWASIVVLLVTGFWLIFGFYDGIAAVGIDVHTMLLLGIVMMALFGFLYFGPYKRMRQAIAEKQWPEAGRRLGQVRLIIAVNLTLGLVTVAIGAGGRFF